MKIRWLYLAIGVVITLFLGLIYAWSLFVNPMQNDIGFTHADTSLTFTLSIVSFSIGTVVGGILLSALNNPRLVLLLSAASLAFGFAICSSATTPLEIFIFYGVVLSLGTGIGYIVIMSLVSKWFKDKIGLASGILLMGFGLGSFILGGLARFLIESISWRETFLLLGLASALVLVAGACVIRYPSTQTARALDYDAKDEGQTKVFEFTPLRMLEEPSFWMFFLWCVLMIATGLVVIGNAATLAEALGGGFEIAIVAVGLVALCNGMGRLFFGYLYDHAGRGWCMFTNSLLSVASMSILLSTIVIKSQMLLFIAFALAGFSYGGIPPTSSALIFSFFGPKNYTINFSMIILAVIPGALLGPFLTGMLITLGDSYTTIAFILLIFSATALMLGLFIRKPMRS